MLTYDTSLIPVPETRNAVPALSYGSLAHSTTARATSSVVSAALMFLRKSTSEIPREEASVHTFCFLVNKGQNSSVRVALARSCDLLDRQSIPLNAKMIYVRLSKIVV